MLINVFNTPWFETTGIRLEDFGQCGFFKLENAAYNDRSFKEDDVEPWKLTGKYGCNYEKAYFIHHCNKFEQDPTQYNKIFHKYLESGLMLKKETEVTKHPSLAFMWEHVAGTKIITGQGNRSSSPDSHYSGSEEAKKVYSYSVDIGYYIWFKTQDEVAKEINRQLSGTTAGVQRNA